MRISLFSLSVLTILCVAVPAASQTPPEAPAQTQTQPGQSPANPPGNPTSTEEEPPRGAWYGWQTLIADALGAGLGLTAYALWDEPSDDAFGAIALVGTGMYATGTMFAPTAHWTRRREWLGFGDAAMRGALPPTTALIGLMAWCISQNQLGSPSGCAARGSQLGFFAGALLSAAIDAGVFAYEKPPSEKREKIESTWYGWQTGLADAVGLAFGIWGVANAGIDPTDGEEIQNTAVGLAALSWLTGLVGAPVIHLFHRNWAEAGIDLVVRLLGAPSLTLAGLVGYCAASGGAEQCAEVGVAGGFVAGIATVAVFDAMLLAWDDESGTTRPMFRVRPVIQADRDRTIVGIGTTF